MKIIHRVSFAYDVRIARRLEKLGIEVGHEEIISFDIEENHPSWKALEALIAKHDGVDICTTKFTAKELRSAQWLRMQSTWHHGYPEPRDEWPHTEAYDSNEHCMQCGIKCQKGPLSIGRSPKWGKRSITQLNWIFDEFLAKPDVWTECFRPHGIGKLPVLSYRSKKELNDVVQLDLRNVETVDLRLDGRDSQLCRACGVQKFFPITRGEFPAFRQTPKSEAVVRSAEFFGDGGRAFKGVFVSQAIYESLERKGVKGVQFTVVAQT